MQRIKALYTNLIILTYISIFIIDLISIHFPIFGLVGVFFWFLSYFLILIFVFKCLIYISRNLLSNKFLITIFSAFILGAIVFVNITNSKNLSGETTQEINCALNHFRNSNDAGFRQTCLFGYPTRQFFLPMVPSLLFGRSYFNLNFGMSIYFFIGLIIFVAGIMRHLENYDDSGIYGGLIISLIPHIFYFNNFMFIYEQSIFPFCFALILCGFYLHFQKIMSKEILFLMAINIYYLIFSYTPSLALVGLVLLILVYESELNKKQTIPKRFIMFVFIISIVSLVLSAQFRSDVNIIGENIDKATIINNIVASAKHIIFQTQGDPFLSPIFKIIFLISLLGGLLFIFGFPFFIVSLWIVATIIFSIISKGYSYYGLDFRLHRATVIFPVLFFLYIYLFKRLKKILNYRVMKISKWILISLYLLLLITGIIFQREHLNSKKENQHLILNRWLKEKLSNNHFSNQDIIFFAENLNTWDLNLISLNDSLQYFNPNLYSTIVDENCENLINRDLNKKTYLVISKVIMADCLKSFVNNTKYIDSLVISESQKLDLYKLNVL